MRTARAEDDRKQRGPKPLAFGSELAALLRRYGERLVGPQGNGGGPKPPAAGLSSGEPPDGSGGPALSSHDEVDVMPDPGCPTQPTVGLMLIRLVTVSVAVRNLPVSRMTPVSWYRMVAAVIVRSSHPRCRFLCGGAVLVGNQHVHCVAVSQTAGKVDVADALVVSAVATIRRTQEAAADVVEDDIGVR